MIAVAQADIGIRESGGNNRGMPYVRYMKPYGYGPGTMWCGLFVNDVFRRAKVEHGVKGPALAANWSIPASMVVYKWGKPVQGKVPMSGDLALYRFGGKRIDHIEIVINWPDDEDFFWVIGGNTSNPANPRIEGVFAKQRPKSSAMVVNRIDYFNHNLPKQDYEIN